MACASEFLELANRNPYVRNLHDQGYDTDLVGGYFALYGLPYLDEHGALQHGDLYTPVPLGADGVIQPGGTHQVWWVGGNPHNKDGVLLSIGAAKAPQQITPRLTTDLAFSLKLKDENHQPRDYISFQEKIETYLSAIVNSAKAMHPDATPLRGIERRASEQGSPLRLPDTSSANYGINDVSDRLRGKKIAIVGLGGTGSCILDFVVRTHLEQIALFDDDIVHVHTLFRVPGVLPKAAIGNPKVDVLAQHYDAWHSGIIPVVARISDENVDRLREFDFVFVSVDDGPSRGFVVEFLSREDVPYVDCGMGLNRSHGATLNGVVRITGVDRAAYDRTLSTPYLPTANAKDAEYRKQAQIIELNALNAAFAVIRFKQHFGLYERVGDSAWHTFETATFGADAEGSGS